jgi:hypothetical protein
MSLQLQLQPHLTCCPALARPSIASSAEAISSAPLFAMSLLGIAKGGACAAMPAAAALCVSVATAMPDAMNTSLQDSTAQQDSKLYTSCYSCTTTRQKQVL